MSNDKKDVWVGLFVLLGIVAFVFLALRAGNMSSFSFAPSYTVSGKFDNIGGLKVRAPIKSAGVVVGRVADINFDDKSYQAIVTFSIESKFAFPKDTSAIILTSGLLGEQYIGLDAGGDDRMLVAGDTISMTQSAIVLENLISQFLYNKADEEGAASKSPPAAQ